MSQKAKPILSKQDAVKQFVRGLEKLDHSRSTREKFRDLISLAYFAHAKLTAPTQERADELEARYMRVVNSYQDKDTIRAYPELMAIAIMQCADFCYDFLGMVSSEIGALNSEMGQFFTPWEVSYMMARMQLSDVGPMIEREGYITFGEPAAGAGGLVLAAAQVVREQGFDPSIHMLTWATDISEVAFQMCYLQLNWAGIAAYVERGDTLRLEHFEGAWTVGALRFHDQHGHLSFQKPKMEQEPNFEERPFQWELF